MTTHEDGPPNVEPPERHSYPGFSGPDEITQTDLRTPAPVAQRKTLSPEDANQVMVRRALEASAAATEALTKLLPTLATKDDVERLEAGIKMAIAASENAIEAVDKLRADIKTWLFDEEHSIGKDLGFAREQANSALGAISTLPPRLKAIEDKLEIVAEAAEKSLRVACGSWMQVTTGEVDERDRETISAIIVSHGSGR